MKFSSQYLIITFLLLWLEQPELIAQAPDVLWQKTYGGPNLEGIHSGSHMQQTSDNGYIITAWTESYGVGSADVYLIKTDKDGNLLWDETYGGTGWEEGRSVIQTAEGGYAIVGYTNSFRGNYDVYLIKINQSGKITWTKTYGGLKNDLGFSIQQTQDGGFIITGYTLSYGAGHNDVYLIKTNSRGDIEWENPYGGLSEDAGHTVFQTHDGGYFIAGMTRSYGNGDSDFYLLKTDSNGNIKWQKTYGGNNTDVALNAQQTTDGGYIIVGYSLSFGGGQDIYLIKTNENGDKQWSKVFGGSNAEQGYTVHQTTDDGYFITGFTRSFGVGFNDVYLIKTNPNGDEIWSKTIGRVGDESGITGFQTSDGGYSIVGYTNSFGAGNIDIYLIRLAPEIRKVHVDIKPGSCPNPLNVKSKGVLPAAILGTSGFNITNIDISSIKFEGVAPIRSSIEDVNTPANSPDDCSSDGPDGFVDLCLKFDTQEIVSAIGSVEDGQEIALTLTGNLNDGTPIEGMDKVRIIAKGKKRPKLLAEDFGNEPNIENFSLFQNYPNPFNPETEIRFDLPEQAHVKLMIFNTLGQKIKALVEMKFSEGSHSVHWDGIDEFGNIVSGGLYLCRMQTKNYQKTIRMLYLK